MTIDGLVTLLALVVAVLAVIPSALRRAIALKFGLWEWFIITASLIIVLFLEYYDTAKVLFRIPSIGFAQTSHITPPSLAFLVVLLCGFFVVMVVLWKRIPARRMEKLQRLIETLVEGEQFADVIEILSPYIPTICNIHAGRYGLQGKKENMNEQMPALHQI